MIKILGDLLDVVDNLDRALSTKDSEAAALKEGVGIVRNQFISVLEHNGIRRMSSEKARFDPRLHEAVAAVPVPAREDDERVVGIVKEGYLINDEILRPAQVAVGKYQSE